VEHRDRPIGPFRIGTRRHGRDHRQGAGDHHAARGFAHLALPLSVRIDASRVPFGVDQPGQPDRNAHILPWPRLMVWRITGAVTWSEIWMFHISLSPCAAKSATGFGFTDTSGTSGPRGSSPGAFFPGGGRPNTPKLSSRPPARSL